MGTDTVLHSLWPNNLLGNHFDQSVDVLLFLYEESKAGKRPALRRYLQHGEQGSRPLEHFVRRILVRTGDALHLSVLLVPTLSNLLRRQVLIGVLLQGRTEPYQCAHQVYDVFPSLWSPLDSCHGLVHDVQKCLSFR